MSFHPELPHCQSPKDLALYIRYGATHDRAFHKCIDQLAKLRAAQRKEEAGFERAERLVLVARDKEASQQRQQAAETRKQQLHEARIAALTAKTHTKKQHQQPKTTPAPVSPTTKQPQETPFVSLEHPEIPACLANIASSQAA